MNWKITLSFNGKEAVRTTQEIQVLKNLLRSMQDIAYYFPDAKIVIESISAEEYRKSEY